MNIQFTPAEPARIPHRIDDGPLTYRYARWKGTEQNQFIVSSDGEVYLSENGKHASVRILAGIPYLNSGFDSATVTRIDYLVAYTFLGEFDDIIRIQHRNMINSDNRASNLEWVRKSTILAKYIQLGILEPDGSVKEKWAPCRTEHNPNLGYEISNCGNVRKADGTPVHILEQHGYKVFFYLDERTKNTRVKMVHVAVAEAFIPNDHPDVWTIVNHIDGNKANCMVYNLEWTDIGGNGDHAFFNGLRKSYSSTSDKVHEVCRLLEEGKLSHVEIAERTGIDRKSISDIYNGRRHRDISQNYQFAQRKWTDEMKQEIENYVRDGYKGRQIADKMHLEYDQPFISLYERTRRILKANGERI